MNVVGKSVPRVDALDKVTGRARFVSDLDFADQLVAKVMMSPHPHARILSIDTGQAKQVPGVKAVITARDIPGENAVPVIKKDMPLLTDDAVLYYGQPVAAVAAETAQAAEEALKKIKVEYKVLPAVLSVEEAISDGATQINDEAEGNIHSYHKICKGNVDEGFAAADVIIEHIYRTPYQEHAYLETQGMLAVPDHEGSMTVYGSMQCPFYVREGVAHVLGISLNQVRVVQCVTGGGFGGKEDVPSLVAGIAAVLAKKSNRPVKFILTREEDIIMMSKRHPGLIYYKTGATKDGKLTAIEVTYYLNGGGYSTLSPVVMWRGAVHAAGPYKCANVKVDAKAVATNLVPCGAYRGFGTPQVLFAHESQMDVLAEKLGMSPVDIRKVNALELGDETSTGQQLKHSFGLKKTLNEALKKSSWDMKRKEYEKDSGTVRRGIGLSTVFYGMGLGAGGAHMARAGAFVQVHQDATINIAVGTTEMGQGMRTVLSQIAAEEFGVEVTDVHMLQVDTSRVPDSGPTVASRSTTLSGNAIRDGCKKIKQMLAPVAAEMLNCKTVDVGFNSGRVYAHDLSSDGVSFAELIATASHEKVHMAAQGWAIAPYTSFDPDTGQGWAYFTYASATNIAEVQVDLATCVVTVLRITAAHELGRAINPQQVEGQIQGGTLQGMGYGLSEEILHQDGVMINPDFSTYIIPTSMDAPVIDPIIVEEPFPDGPFGAKGFGELPLMGVAPAVANAVTHAIGARSFEIPLTPERLFELLKQNNQDTR